MSLSPLLTIDRGNNEGQRAAKKRTTLCSVDGRLVALRSHSCFAPIAPVHSFFSQRGEQGMSTLPHPSEVLYRHPPHRKISDVEGKRLCVLCDLGGK